MVLGNFNSILTAEDRIGGNPVSWEEVVGFHSCVTDCGLIELPSREINTLGMTSMMTKYIPQNWLDLYQ